MKIDVLKKLLLEKHGVEVPDYTLYRAQKFALRFGDEEYKKTYNKLHKYGSAI